VRVVWDGKKAEANRQKHGVDFADAATVLDDELALTLREDDLLEPRRVTIGRDARERVLVIVYAWRGRSVRLISARRATRREKRTYQERR
jgi:uncharacterized DUF497 family protein